MMTTEPVLGVYAAMAELTDQMVQAADGGDWDRLVELEARCAAHVCTLKADEPGTALSGERRERKVALIRQMLDDDRKIRDLTMPWMAHLSALINSAGTERRLVSAYGRV